jgi:hypothetical protein
LGSFQNEAYQAMNWFSDNQTSVYFSRKADEISGARYA